MDTKMKTLILLLLLPLALLWGAEINGSLSTGFYWGTPYWNADNFAGRNSIPADDLFMRSVNHLRLNGKFFDKLTVHMHALRSDGFQSDNRLSETKIYQVYGQYNFARGMIKAGRFTPFNRWIRGSIDGGGFAYALNKQIQINVMGGLYVPYGKIYDSDNVLGLGYADVGWRNKTMGAKVKLYADEDITKAGADFFGIWRKISFSGNYGFDFTNQRLADGGLNLFYAFNNKLTVSGNYRLFRSDDWQIAQVDFPSILIERYSLGLRYKVFGSYFLDFRQMLSMTAESSDYLTYLNLNGKYFHVGVNYLAGDSNYERIGLILGARYSPLRGLNLAAGIAPVDYLTPGDEERLQSIAYYFRANYSFLESFIISANFNYYQDNRALDSSHRGGIQIRYNFGS